MDVRAYNREAWNKEVERGNIWTRPVGEDVVAKARAGEWQVQLTPSRFVPRGWFPELRGADVLCLAGGGGQQGPVFAAAGARVTVYDNSPRQLHQDRLVAERDDLAIKTVEGDMADLGALADQSFDLVFHPCSNCFAEDVLPVWREAFRVLRPGGTLLAGFANPVMYAFDQDLMRTERVLQVRFALPYSDVTSLSDEERARYTSYGAPLEFSHTLEEQIGGQTAAGFLIAGLYEDDWGGRDVVDQYMKAFLATRAVKPHEPLTARR
jgi:SAM-dependent methyltransferase